MKLSRKHSPTLALALVILSFAIPLSAQTQERILQTITVTGQGVETIPTTIARVQLGVEVRGQTAEQVQQDVARRTSAVLEVLRSRNVPQLQTTGIRLQPRYDYRNNEQRFLGYIGTNSVSFRIKTEEVGALMDAAIEAGATRIDGISFFAAEPAIAAAQKEALRRATQDAQDQADAVLSALNLSRKDVVRIAINGANHQPPPRLQNALVRAESADTPVVGGDREVRASVTLEISY